MSDISHEIIIKPAFDDMVNGCKHDKAGDHGRGAVTLLLIARAANSGAVLSVHTPWHLPETLEKGTTIYGAPLDIAEMVSAPPVAVIDLHRSEPTFDGHKSRHDCWVIGGDCYSDAAYIAADPIVDALMREGSEAAFVLLDEWVTDE